MAANTNLKTTINFGARIDSSFTGATGSLNKALKGIGTETARNRALQTAWGQQMARSLSGAAGETEKLSRAQDTLKKSIQEATLAGKDTVRLKKRYAEVSKEIEKATRKQNRLTEAMKREVDMAERAEKAERELQRRRESSLQHQLKTGARLALGKAGEGFGDKLLTAGKWASGGVVAGTIAAVATPLMLNSKTAEELGLARGYGMSIEKYKAGGALAAQFGLNAENFGDLSEEGTNKIWEEGNEKTLNPMLKQLGLSKGVLKKMGREKAFDLLMQKLSTMKDGAAAASLADQLMGAESNKILTGLHTIGKTYNQAMEEARRYNLLTQEGAEGAMRANIAVNRLWGVAESGMQDAAGKISGALTPTIERATGELSQWATEMQPKLTKSIDEWLKPDANGETGPQRLWDGLAKFGHNIEMVGDVVMAVAERLQWLIPDKEQVTRDQNEIIEYLSNGNPIAGAKSLAEDKNLEGWFKKQRFDDPDVVAALVQKRRAQRENENTGFNNVNNTAATEDSYKDRTDTALSVIPFHHQPQQNYNDHRNINITVNAAPGQSTEDVGKSVYDAFMESLPKGWESPSGNNAFDMPSL
ncbi:hypothetical protein [Enterobacter asburiae]|uniref:hypothetical protein n=1 Tax=Enterobacter asburiae TaxID=61645 RepID=UPI001575FFC3|nr:hypothetical protein [Enterobacter asburiae]NQF31047.1 hypothetical protein [Enterobacter asburiae]